jgi:hypothetical protein
LLETKKKKKNSDKKKSFDTGTETEIIISSVVTYVVAIPQKKRENLYKIFVGECLDLYMKW